MKRAPRLLLLLGQSPFDLASGAAVSMRHTAYLLASAGWQVRALSSTLGEGARPHSASHGAHLAHGELDQVEDEGVLFEQMHCAATGNGWQAAIGAGYDRRYRALLAQFRPDLVFTFGGDPADLRRRAWARAAGARVVFALHNLAYLRLGLAEYDHLLAPSAFLAGRYRDAGHGPVHVLPPPLWPRDVLAAQRTPVFFTFVNPERAKGAELVARLAARHPGLPFLVVESRAHAGHFLHIAAAAGIAAAQLANVMVSPGAAPARDIFAATRVLLMPSLVDEAAGRLAAEALANGIPAVVSDAGGLPDTVGRHGLVLPWRHGADGLPRVDAAAVAAWSAALQPLAADAPYAAACAATAGHPYDPVQQRQSYTAWFNSLLPAG